MRRLLLPLSLAASLLAACSATPVEPVTVAASPAAGTGADAAVVPMLGLPIKAVVNGKPLAGYDLSILDPISGQPLPVMATAPTHGSAIVSDGPPKTNPDGSFKFLLVLEKGQDGSLIASGGGNLIASGGGNLIASGGGNLVASGGGNLIASGGGNLIASGGGNLIASGGGNLIASGGGNLVASGGGNLIASGGGNLTAAGGDVNLRVVAAGLGSRVEAVSTLTSAGFGRVYRTLQVPGDIVMDVASTITARLAVKVLQDTIKLSPEARQQAREEQFKTLTELRGTLEKALELNPDIATQILESGGQSAPANTDALIGSFLGGTGLSQFVPSLLSPEMTSAAASAPPLVAPPPPPNLTPPPPADATAPAAGPAPGTAPAPAPAPAGGSPSGGGAVDNSDQPTITPIDLH